MTDPLGELGKRKQTMLPPLLGKMRAFPMFDLHFHYKQVCVGGRRSMELTVHFPGWASGICDPLEGPLHLLLCRLRTSAFSVGLALTEVLGNGFVVAKQDSAPRRMHL